MALVPSLPPLPFLSDCRGFPTHFPRGIRALYMFHLPNFATLITLTLCLQASVKIFYSVPIGVQTHIDAVLFLVRLRSQIVPGLSLITGGLNLISTKLDGGTIMLYLHYNK